MLQKFTRRNVSNRLHSHAVKIDRKKEETPRTIIPLHFSRFKTHCVSVALIWRDLLLERRSSLMSLTLLLLIMFHLILVESKEKLPGPKHQTKKFYEARKSRAIFRQVNPEHNFQSCTIPERKTRREKDKCNFEVMQHLFYYSQKKP